MKCGAALCVVALVAFAAISPGVDAQQGNYAQQGGDNGRPQLVNDNSVNQGQQQQYNQQQGRQQQYNQGQQQQFDQGQQQQQQQYNQEGQDDAKMQAHRERKKQHGERLARMYAQTNDVNDQEEIKRRFLSKEEYEKQRRGGSADPNLMRARGAQGDAGLNPRDYNSMGRRQRESGAFPGEIDPSALGNIPEDVRERINKMNEIRRAQAKFEEERLKGIPDGPNLGVRDGLSGMDEQQEAWPGAQHEKAHPYATRYKGERPPKEMHEYVKTDMITFKLGGGATETFYEFSSPDTEQFEIGYVLRGPEHSQLEIVVFAPNGKEVHRETGKKYHSMKVKIAFEGAYRVDITNIYRDDLVVSFGLETNDNIGKELRAVSEREKELAIDENLEPIAEVLERVDVRLADIRKEQRYMLIRERDHQLTQDNTHYRVMTYSVLESIVFVGAAIFQNLWVINLVKTSKPLGGV